MECPVEIEFSESFEVCTYSLHSNKNLRNYLVTDLIHRYVLLFRTQTLRQ